MGASPQEEGQLGEKPGSISPGAPGELEYSVAALSTKGALGAPGEPQSRQPSGAGHSDRGGQ